MSVLLSAVSHFSLLRGVLSPEAICKIARDLGYTSIAVTDFDNLYGLPSVLRCCEEFELVPIIGAQLTGGGCAVLLYAEGNEGFSNLCRIISERHCNESFNLLSSVKSGAGGIHAVTDSIDCIEKLHDICPVYYRMTRPRKPPAKLAEMGVHPLIIPPAAFRDKDEYEIHRMLRAIDLNTTLSRLPDTEMFGTDAVFHSWKEICDRFEVFGDAIEATESFASSLRSRTAFGTFMMPRLPCRSSIEQLREKAYDGARHRYGEISDTVKIRLEYELELIGNKGFADYFLVVDDIVKQSPRTCGRGSGAASLVAYSLGITNVDPIRYNLMFERFLNPGRVDPPDIDVDFAWDERDDILKYVFDKYGKAHTAMIATHQTCGARMAIREVARIHGLTESEITAVTGKIPYYLDLPENSPGLKDVFANYPTLKDVVLDSPWPLVLAQAGKIMGMPRGIGTHCGGVVITPMPINTVAPVQYSAKGVPIVQWEKDGAEEMGLVKIDLLGNRSLAVIRDAIANVKSDGVAFDERRWDPQSDPQTIDLLAKGKTIGVFYVESPAMRLLQQKTGVGDFEHMVIHSSIIRPAANKYIKEYIRRLKGGRYEVLHQSLRETLSETYGIMVYQEDVSKVAMAMAGFSVENADILRKIMSKKTKGRKFNDYRNMFFEGAAQREVEKKVIEEVWNMMLSFSGYSFCKPHSASYVQVSFQSAYLKTHYPAAFLAAVISNYGGYYSTQAYVSEAQRLGITVMPPDVNRSENRFISKDNTIITGLCGIKGLTRKALDRIIKERESDGPYKNMEDLLTRASLDEPDAERLVLAGACDRMCEGINRARQFWLMRGFFRGRHGGPVPDLKPIGIVQFLKYQYAMLGFLTPFHPITLVECAVKGLIKARDLQSHTGKTISVLGWCITSKTVSTKFGESMDFVTFEDETGVMETVFFPDIYRKFASMLERHAAFVVSGKVTEEYGVAVLEVNNIKRP